MARRWITTDSADPRLPDDVIQATSVTGVTGHDLVDVDPADPRLPDLVKQANELYYDARRAGELADRPLNAPAITSGSDDTGALNDALALLATDAGNYARDTGGSNPSYTWARPVLTFQSGRHRIAGPVDPTLVQNVHLAGAGKDSTVIHYTGTGELFTLGVADTTPTSPYQGTAAGLTLSDMSIACIAEIDTVAHEGTRTSKCVADYFNGHVAIKGCRIYGFGFGHFSDAGGDFTNIEDSEFWFNDVGVYLGPASDQSRVHGCAFYANEVGMVIGGAQMSVKDCQFIDSLEYHIIRESNTLTRGGSSVSGIAYDERHIEISDVWFEDNAAVTGRIAKACLYLASDTTGFPGNISIHDGIVVAGGTTGVHKRAFVKSQMACRRVEVERISEEGDLDWWAEREAGEFPIIDLLDVTTEAGHTLVPYWGNGTTVDTTPWVGARARLSNSRRTMLAAGSTLAEFGRTDAVNDTDVRVVHNADGSLTLGEYVSGAWRDRLKVDVEAWTVTFRPDSSPVAVTRDTTTVALSVGATGYHMTERTDPTAPAANGAVIYAKDNGAGKTQLMVRFATGAVQQIAIEP